MTPWLDIAQANVGLKEIPGKAANAKIVAFYAESGHPEVKDDETAWCAAFVGACLKRAGLPNTGLLTARSYLKYGVAIERPRKGCIVVLKRGNSSWEGHVGFFVKQSATNVYLLGGNQGNAVSIAPFPKSKLLGYRWPVETTPHALKVAGSTEIEKADILKRGSEIGAATVAAAKVADETGALDQLKDVSGNVSVVREFMEGLVFVAQFISAHTALSTLALLIVGSLLARWWIKNRLLRHSQGQPLSRES